MNKILWIDNQILKFFNKIAKDFNWVTGLDNFFLALLSLGLSFLFTTFCKVFEQNQHVLDVTFFQIIFLYLFLKVTWMIETFKLEETIIGAKDQGLYLALGIVRYSWLSVSFFEFFTGSFISLSTGLFFIFIWACFLSIDQPPFKRSQAWQKIKNWLKGFSRQPELKPIPVTVPHN